MKPPKEKAEELINAMTWDGEMSDEKCFADFAKECALILVDEIINVCNSEISHCSDKTYFYWQEVKKEVETYKN